MDTELKKYIVDVPETDSSNNHANRLLADNSVEEGTVFLAHRQMAGRGQINNSWESEPGMNLTFSLVLQPFFLEIKDQFMLSKVVSLGICSALEKYGIDLKIKWPNDIYVGNKKLAGILIENSVMSGQIRYSVVGVGLNVNQEKFLSNAPNPVSMKNISRTDYDTEEVLLAVMAEIRRFYEMLKNDAFDLIDSMFLSKLFRLNELHQFVAEGDAFDGRIIGVNEIGQLLIEDVNAHCIREFHFKEVEYVL